MLDKWRHEPGHFEDWSDLYQITTDGKVSQEGIELKQYRHKDRYYVVLDRNGKTYKRWVHRCVATTYPEICGQYQEDFEVDHINSNPQDNRAENLRWVTHKENMNNPATKEKRKAINESYKGYWKDWKPGTLNDFYREKYSYL